MPWGVVDKWTNFREIKKMFVNEMDLKPLNVLWYGKVGINDSIVETNENGSNFTFKV